MAVLPAHLVPRRLLSDYRLDHTTAAGRAGSLGLDDDGVSNLSDHAAERTAPWTRTHVRIRSVGVIRIRGHTVSDGEAAERAARLREQEDAAASRAAERLELGLLMGTALVGTDQLEARALLTAIAHWTPESLRVVAKDLREYVAAAR